MTRRTIEIGAFCAALLLAALIFHAWLDAHDDQLRLSSTLATQKQALDAADARERDRNSTLKDALAQIDTLKRRAQTETPTELARALEDVLHLPQPITIVPTSMPNPSSPSATQSSPSPVSGTGTPACANSRGKTDECLAQASDRSADSHDVRTAEIRPAPLPSSPPPQGSADDSQQGIAHHAKSLRRLFRGGSPRAASDTPSSTSSAAAPASAASASAASASSASASAEVRAAVTGSASSTEPANSAAQIPAADLAPLYNYVQDCRACQLQLTAAKQNASDDAAKIRALTRERDAAVTAAKGGPCGSA